MKMGQRLLWVYQTIFTFSQSFNFVFIVIVMISLFCIIVKWADLEGLPHFQSKIYFHYGVGGNMCVCTTY